MSLRFAVLFLASLPAAFGQADGVQDSLRKLNSSEPRERAQAAYALATAELTPEVLRALRDALVDEDRSVRVAACSSLRRKRTDAQIVLPDLIRLVQDPDGSVRHCGIGAMGDVGAGDPAALATLYSRLNDDNPILRASAVTALGGMGPNAAEAVGVVLVLVDDADSNVRTSAILALGQFGEASRQAIPFLIEALRDANARVRRTAATTLAQMGEWAKPAVSALIQSLDDPSREVRGAALDALSRIGGSEVVEAVPVLIRILSNPDEWVNNRMTAAHVLSKIGEPARVAIPALAEALSADHEYVRGAALRTLSIIDPREDLTQAELEEMMQPRIRPAADESVIPGGLLSDAELQPLLEALGAEDAKTRSDAAKALAGHGLRARNAAAGLGAVLADADGEVRSAAAEALSQMGAAALDPTLRALRDARKDVRLRALGILARLENRAAPAVPALAPLIRAEELEVRQAAVAVLGYANASAEAALSLLREAADEPALRPTVYRAVAELRGSGIGGIDLLLEGLAGDDAEARGSALYALGMIGPLAADHAGVVAELLDRPETVRAALVCLTTLKSREPGVIERIAGLVKSEDADVRRSAAAALGDLYGYGQSGRTPPSEGFAEMLHGLLREDSDIDIRANAALALGGLGAHSAIAAPDLIAALGQSDEMLQVRAATALGRIGMESPSVAAAAAPALIQALASPSQPVRTNAAIALGFLRIQDALAPLTLALQDSFDSVRRAAAEAIRRIEQGVAR